MVVIIEYHPLHDIPNGSTPKRENNTNKMVVYKRSSISLTDLPPNILVEILTRLPLRTLFVARSVCKTLGFLSTPNPHFINLYSSNAPQIIVFQYGGFKSPSSLLHMADHALINYENSQPKPLFQLPKMGWKIYGNFRDVNRLFLSNSCNGLLYFLQNGYAGDYPSLVCNPVTSEYIVIPGVAVDPAFRFDSRAIRSFWLGFSPGTDQYKVLRIFQKMCDKRVVGAAQVFVIGSDSWRDVDDTPPLFICDFCQTFVNGLMYWHDGRCWRRGIISFDFEREKFGEVALPTEFQDEVFMTKQHVMSIGVLGGCLCLSCNNVDTRRVDLWVMRKCGNQQSWTKEFVFYTEGPSVWAVSDEFKPLQFLGNRKISLHWWRNSLVFYDPRTKTLRYVKLHGDNLGHKVVALTPSFVPLKEALKVEKVLTLLRPRGDEKGL